MPPLFETSDFPLSSTLYYFDFKVLDIDKSNPKRAVLQFEDTPALQECVKNYYHGTLGVEPRKMFMMQKMLKSRIYDSNS